MILSYDDPLALLDANNFVSYVSRNVSTEIILAYLTRYKVTGSRHYGAPIFSRKIHRFRTALSSPSEEPNKDSFAALRSDGKDYVPL